MPAIQTSAFYRFVALPDFAQRREPLLRVCEQHGVLGTILLAEEGINGTIAGRPAAVEGVLNFLREDPRLAGLTTRDAAADSPPFYRMKVRLKREIVTLGVAGIDAAQNAGQYVEPEDWNALISDPDVVVIDTRNDYEVAIGSFRGAVNPRTASFRDLPGWLESAAQVTPNSKVAMFCTGGIRCEKSTALLRSRGVEEVFHLRGGILNYLDIMAPQDSMFEGHCFVFDERVSVGHGLTPGPYSLCRACRYPLSAEDQASPHYVPGVSCARCHDARTPEQRARSGERHKQMLLAEQRNEVHLGARPPVATAHTAWPILYSFRRCPFAMRARMALYAAGLACELREVVLRDKPAALLAISPKATVPVLVCRDGAVLEQSLDIMLWALRQRDPRGWLKPDAGSLADMLDLIAAADGDFKNDLDRYKYANRYPDVEPLRHRAAGASFLSDLDARISTLGYLHGRRAALADFAIAPFVRQFRLTDSAWFDAQPWAALHAWLTRILASSEFSAVMHKYAPWRDGDAPVRLAP